MEFLQFYKHGWSQPGWQGCSNLPYPGKLWSLESAFPSSGAVVCPVTSVFWWAKRSCWDSFCAGGVSSTPGMPGWGHLWFLLLSVTFLFLIECHALLPSRESPYFWLDHVYRRLVENEADTVDLPNKGPVSRRTHWDCWASQSWTDREWCHGLTPLEKHKIFPQCF